MGATSRNLSPASRSHGTLPRVKLQQSFKQWTSEEDQMSRS